MTDRTMTETTEGTAKFDENDGRSDEVGSGEWNVGDYVQAVAVHSLPSVNGRFGTVVAADSKEATHVTIAVHGPDFSRVVHEIPRANLKWLGPNAEERVHTAWLYARQGNGIDLQTKPGQSGENNIVNGADEKLLLDHLAEATVQAWVGDDEAGSVLRVLECTESELHDFGPQLSFVRRATPIPERVGVRLACWVYPGDDGRSDGRTNVLATFLSVGLDGRVQTPVVGTCFIVRICPESGNVVHFTRDEVTRLLFFMKDALTFVKSSESGVVSDSTWSAWKASYPHYEQGCVLTQNGFTGFRTCVVDEDGTLAVDPVDALPINV